MKLPTNYVCKQMTDVKLWLFIAILETIELRAKKMTSDSFKDVINKIYLHFKFNNIS